MQNSQLNFLWKVNPNIPFNNFLNEFSFKESTTDMLGAKTEVVISMYASNATNTAAATYTLPINTPPDSGTISATPLEGDSLSTSFEISTSGWVDDDLPLNY